MGQFDIANELLSGSVKQPKTPEPQEQETEYNFDIAGELLSGKTQVKPEPQVQPVEEPIAQPTEQQKPWQITKPNEGGVLDSFGKAINNLPESTGQIVKDTYNMVTHPVDTLAGVWELAKGVASKVIPGKQDSEEAADALADYFMKRYGSLEGVKKTFEEDPAGLLLDGFAVAGLAGTSLKAANLGAKSKTVSKIAEGLQKSGTVMDPLYPVSKGVQGVAKAFKGKPGELYERAAKMSTILKVEDVEKMVNTALDNEIMPTRKGIERLRGKIDTLNNKISETIDKAVSTNTTISVSSLFDEFSDLMHPNNLGGKPLDSQAAIKEVRRQIVEANRKINRVGLTPAEAQKLKQNIYKEMEASYEKMNETSASKTAQMAVARAAKKAIEQIVPEIKMLNRADGDLIELLKVIERSARRISNHDLISIRPALSAAAGGAIGGGPAASAGLVLGILGSPQAQAKMAIVIRKLQKQGINITPTGTATRLGLIESSRINDDQNEGDN